MKIYRGLRTRRGGLVTVDERVLEPRHDLRNHSPEGFEWGYGGSGPAQLALALLADCLESDERALKLYQAFKRAVIARLEGEEWELTEAEVRQAADRLAAAREARP